jgi:hypothetical protein
MTRLRLLGLALMAVFALGAVAATSASAVESNRGFLTLEKGESSVEMTSESGEFKDEVIGEGEKSGVTCTGIKLLKVILDSPGAGHFNLGKDGELHFTGCKLGGIVSCSSQNAAGEKDPKEVILFLVDTHLINLEGEKKELLAGIAWLILNPLLEVRPIKINCSGAILELQGAFKGLLVPLFEKKVTLEKDVTDIDLEFKKIKCDLTNEEICQKLLKEEPCLINGGNGFVACSFTTNLFLVTTNKMVLVDD